MFDSTRLRRRFGLLATSSLVASAAAFSFGAVALAPSGALAANECGNPATNGAADDTFTCPPGTYPTGVVYPLTAGDLTLVFDETAAGAVVTTTGGVLVNGLAGDAITLDRSLTGAGAAGTGDLTIVNTLGNGVTLLSPDSDLTIDFSDVDTGDTAMSVTGSTNGMFLVTGGAGNVLVTMSNGSVVGQAGNGITAASGAGTTTLNLGAATVTGTNTAVGANSYAISATGGAVTVTGTGAISATADNFAIGVYASSPGAIVVNTTGTITSTATGGYAWGVYAINTGGSSINITTGAVNVVQSGGLLGGGDGISAYTTGAVTINSGAITTSGLYADGIFVGGVFGIAGNTTITAGPIVTTGANSDGIDVGAHGAVVITTGAITTSGANSDGLEVVSDLSSVSVTTNGAIVASGAGANGILVSGQTGVTINTNANVTANTNAINSTLTGPGSATINVASTSVVRAPGTSATTAAVQVQTVSGSTTTINNAGTIRSMNATVPGAAADLAIQGVGGNVTINNTGRIDGRLNFAGLTGTNRAQINLSGAGNWHTTGLTTLSGGNDVIANGGLIATSGATTFDFGADTGIAPRDSFNNTGRLIVGETTGASTLTVTGLETFTNSGSVFFGSLNGTSSDGQTNDRIVMTATGGGTSFVGAGGTLFMDANLGVASQLSCAAATVADCISLPGGTVSGSTRIRINNTNTGPGGLNTAGITLVDATGGSIATGSVVIDPASTNYVTRGGAGAIDTGFFFYRLVPQGARLALISAPDREAFEFVQLGGAVTDVFYLANEGFYDRQADLRDGLGEGDRAGVWLKIYGSQSDREETASFNSAGTVFTYDTGFDQTTAGLVGGVDLIGGATENGGWLIGVSAGWVDSDVNFDQGGTNYSLSGATAGLYGSFVSGPWYLDGSVSGSWLDVDYQTPNLTPGVPFTQAGSADSLGFQLETGWRFGFGETAFIEPMASVAMVNTSFDDVTVPGGTVEIDDVDSLRASIGVRAGFTADMGTFRVQPTVYVKAWNEFEGDQATTFNNTGTAFGTVDDFSGTFADVGGQVNVFSDGGLTAFVNGGYKWNSDFSATTVKIGFRYTF